MKPKSVNKILETAGITSADELQQHLTERGFNRKTINQSVRGYRKALKSGNDFELRGNNTFKVFDKAGKDITKDGRKLGNSVKTNAADLLGLGKDVSRFVGVLEDMRLGMEDDPKLESKKPSVELASVTIPKSLPPAAKAASPTFEKQSDVEKVNPTKEVVETPDTIDPAFSGPEFDGAIRKTSDSDEPVLKDFDGKILKDEFKSSSQKSKPSVGELFNSFISSTLEARNKYFGELEFPEESVEESKPDTLPASPVGSPLREQQGELSKTGRHLSRGKRKTKIQ